jgi:thiol-disulfide isomerase/thioredoxin
MRPSVPLLAAFLLASPAAGAEFPFAASEPRDVPEVRFLDAEESEVTLADFRGKVVLVNLWATWCAPCRREMPALDRLQAELGGPDFEVVAISVDRAGVERVRAFLDEVGVTRLEIYRDPRMAATRALRAPGLPTSVVLDRQGREVGRVLGDAEWDGPEAKAILAEIIAREHAAPEG